MSRISTSAAASEVIGRSDASAALVSALTRLDTAARAFERAAQRRADAARRDAGRAPAPDTHAKAAAEAELARLGVKMT